MQTIISDEHRNALIRIRDAGGSMDVFLFDPDLRAHLVRLGLVNCTAQRTIELTELGKQQLAKG